MTLNNKCTKFIRSLVIMPYMRLVLSTLAPNDYIVNFAFKTTFQTFYYSVSSTFNWLFLPIPSTLMIIRLKSFSAELRLNSLVHFWLCRSQTFNSTLILLRRRIFELKFFKSNLLNDNLLFLIGLLFPNYGKQAILLNPFLLDAIQLPESFLRRRLLAEKFFKLFYNFP